MHFLIVLLGFVAGSCGPVCTIDVMADSYEPAAASDGVTSRDESIRADAPSDYMKLFEKPAYRSDEVFDTPVSPNAKEGPSIPDKQFRLIQAEGLGIPTASAVSNSLEPVASVESASLLVKNSTKFTPPSINPSDYRRVVRDQVYTDTLKIDEADSDTLYINITFRKIRGHAITISNASNVAIVGAEFQDIRGHGITIANVSNVKIANSTFNRIRDTAILLRRSGSTNTVTIFSNRFDEIGGDGIHAAKRFKRNVDHTNLLIYDNEFKNIGRKRGELYHGIYVQSSGANIRKNKITGFVDSNGISIRSDGEVRYNYIDIESGRNSGSGIKYYSDHKTGRSKTLVIANNTIRRNNLYSAIELNVATQAIPKNFAARDWVVNNFTIVGNNVNAKNHYVIEKSLKEAPWAKIELRGSSRKRKPNWVVIP